MKILRIIARLNVGGPARHVIWLTEGLSDRGYETLLAAGVVVAGMAALFETVSLIFTALSFSGRSRKLRDMRQ